MDDKKKDLLEQNRAKILKSIDLPDTLLGLRKYMIFDYSDQQKVCNPSLHPTDIEKCGALVDIVHRRGDKGFYAFSHSVKRKAKEIYDIIHDEKLVDVENCFICKEKTEEITCQNCLGLMNCVTDPNVTNPIDLADVFDELRKQNNSLIEEIKKIEKEYTKQSAEYQSAKERYHQDVFNHQRYLDEKEKELQGLLKEKRDVTVAKDILDEDIKRLNEKVLSLEQEKIGLKEEINNFRSKHMDKDFYENHTVLYSLRIERLEKDIKKLQQQNQKLLEDCMKHKENNEVSERLLERTKDEFKYKIQCLEKQILEHKDDIGKKTAELSYLRYANEQKSGQIDKQQKDIEDLLVKYQEANNQIKRLQSDSKIAQILNKSDFESVNEITRLTQKNEEYSQKIDELQMSVNKYRHSLFSNMDSYSNQVKDLQRENTYLKDEKSQFERIKEDLEERILELNDEVSMTSHLRFTSLRDTDKNVFLRQINGKCGITIALKKGRVYVGESNTIVKQCKSNYMMEPKVEVSPGDLIMSVQGVDVTCWDFNKVKDFLLSQKDRIHLVLRTPVKRSKSPMNILIDKCDVKHFEDLGLSLHVTVKVRSSSKAEDLGFNDSDEILKVGKKEIKGLSLHDIQAKIREMIKQKPGGIIIQRYSDILLGGARRESAATERSFDALSRSSSMTNSLHGASLYERATSEVYLDFTGNNEPVEHVDEYMHSTSSSYNPPLPPPRGSNSGINRTPSTSTTSSHNLKYSERHQDHPDGYSSVNTYDSDGNRVLPSKPRPQPVTIHLDRKPSEQYGFEITGGNKHGIYIRAITRWTVAEQKGIKVGWKMISIEGLNLEKAALGFAVEVLSKYKDYEQLEFVFEPTPLTQYEEMMKDKPYDLFEIQSQIDYRAKKEGELSFSVGDKLIVVDSCAHDPLSNTDEKTYMWNARMMDKHGELMIGLIPKLCSTRTSTVREHTYEEIGEASPPKICQLYDSSFPKPDMIYKIVTPPEKVTV